MLNLEEIEKLSKEELIAVIKEERELNLDWKDYNFFEKTLIRPGDHILVNLFNVNLRAKDFACLKPGTWLNDEVINLFFGLLKLRDQALINSGEQIVSGEQLVERSHFFSTQFYTNYDTQGYDSVCRWTRKFDIFEMNKVFVPVNISNRHWILIVVYMENRKIQVYDSLGAGGFEYAKKVEKYFIREEVEKKGQQSVDWDVLVTTKNTPTQVNGCDCGVFMCMFAYYISRNMSIRMVSREGMDTDRAFIGLEILKSVNSATGSH